MAGQDGSNVVLENDDEVEFAKNAFGWVIVGKIAHFLNPVNAAKALGKFVRFKKMSEED